MRRRAKPSKDEGLPDPELSDLPQELRWREILARLVGRGCNLDALIADIRAELKARPYDLVLAAGGYQHRTREQFAAAVRAVRPVQTADLSQGESVVLAAIAYFQPVTRAKLSEILGREVSRDLIASLRSEDLIAAGPRSPEPGAPYTYVTAKGFLLRFGFASLHDLPDLEALADAGLIGTKDGFDRLPNLAAGTEAESEEEQALCTAPADASDAD